uniref:C2H2-type domain-containing protein n=1 Tax=Mycena chlorophos TaxID=658473 RepID=A0ABQ0M7R3_MYCCL|nr:predicted protein [Mycena chlorophos]
MAQWSPNPKFPDDVDGYQDNIHGGVASDDPPSASHYSEQHSRNYGAGWVADRSFTHREYASGSQQLDQGNFSSASQHWGVPYPGHAAAPPLPPHPTSYSYHQNPGFAFPDASQPPRWGANAKVCRAPTTGPWYAQEAEDPAPFHDSAGGSFEADVASTSFPAETGPHVQGSSRTERRRKETPSKMHRCDICQKEFPRPSALKTHMNSHNEVRPYHCTFPGCEQSFSVLSNARRHLRTHGVEPPPSSSMVRASERREYAVNFEEPVVQQEPTTSTGSQAPYRVRWIGANERTRGVGWGVRQAEQDEQGGNSDLG